MKHKDVELIKRFFVFLKPYWKQWLLSLLLMLTSVVLQIPVPLSTKFLIDKVIILKSFKYLNVIILIILITTMLRLLAIFFQQRILLSLRGKVLYNLRIKLIQHIQKVPPIYFHKKETGYLMSRLNDDVEYTQGVMADNIISAIQDIFTFIIALVCISFINIKLALICVVLLPVYLICLMSFNKRIRNTSYNVREFYAYIQKDLQEMLVGIDTIKAFTAEIRSTLKVTKKIKFAIKKGIELGILSTLASILAIFVSLLCPVIILWIGCIEIIKGQMTVGGLIAFNAFIGNVFGPPRNLLNLNIVIQSSLAAIERIFEMLDLVPEKEGRKEIEIKEGRVIFDNVSFSYNGTEEVLKNISFRVNPGEVIAIVGRSGVGKTTLVSLIPRFFEPTSGRILIDGVNIGEANLKSLRKQIGICSQETFLFF